MTDVFHIIGFVCTLLSYTALNVTGHSDVSSNEALLALASFLSGSYVRSKV